MNEKVNILIIYTGGTIGMVKEYKSDVLKAFDFRKVMEQIPEIQQLGCHIDSVSF
ncbi:MAG: asparaginase, partial [Eudoraea sp.]|nr:asparaginase [Eudoraea sp.]